MPGDYTRVTFDALKDRIGVLMQQGRVMLDADFNEFVDIVERRIQAGDLDTFFQCVVPRVTPNGFRIQSTGSSFTIGQGRIYVDGILAENHGEEPFEFDRRLEEMRGTTPVAYEAQPYLKDVEELFPLPDGNGPHLVYLDVWQRELTHVEAPDLVEKAVGVDTGTRHQTVWQVKVLGNVGTGVTCATPPEQIEGWAEATAPSAGRLTTSAVGVPEDTDPCTVSPTGGFRGTENRLYRVEVHDPGPFGEASFKWSRDNGSIASAVLAINGAGDRLTVVRTGRDAVLRFRPDDWVEVLDDRLELAGLPGVMRRVESVDDVAGTITLVDPLAATDVDFANPGALNTRVRRWDQHGQVLDDTNAVVADVEASDGVIPIDGAGRFVLENGVLTEFSVSPAGGSFRTGDYWVFAARTVDATVEELDQAPPLGIHHHFCRLAVVTFPETVLDCRVLWPPESEQGCGCTRCVSAASHNSGAFTIQMAVDQVAATGGTICLGPGAYNLTAPLTIAGALSLRLVGHGLGTTLFFVAGGSDDNQAQAAIRVTNSFGVEITRLAVVSFGLRDRVAQSLLIRNSGLVEVHRCGLVELGSTGPRAAAVALANLALGVVLRDNLIFGDNGITALTRRGDQGTGFLGTLGLRVENNVVVALRRAVDLDGMVLHLGDVRIAGNDLSSGAQGAVVTTGFALPSSRTDVVGNLAYTPGNGIVVGSDGSRVSDNDITTLELRQVVEEPIPAGILVTDSVLPNEIDRCRISDNRILGVAGHGIAIRTDVASASIDGNWIEGVAESGIVTEGDGSVELLSVVGNHIVHASRSNDRTRAVAAIRVVRGEQVDVSGNIVRDFALPAVQSASRSGVEVVASVSVRVNGNDIQGVGPAGDFVGAGAGIAIVGPFDRLDVADNTVRRSADVAGITANSIWHALRIAPPVFFGFGTSTLFAVGALRTNVAAVAASGAVRALALSDFTDEAVASADVMDEGSAMFAEISPQALASGFVLVGVGRLFFLPRGRQIVGGRGNLLEARGSRAAADITTSGPCVFSDNRCLLNPSPDSKAPIVDIDAVAAIASANYMERPASPAGAFEHALDIQVGDGPATVLGNIATGGIFLNGAVIGAPWAPLNQQV